MIIKLTAEHVGQDGQWNGQSMDPQTRRWHDNLESGMSWSEHMLILLDAGKLLVNRPNLTGNDAYITHAFFDLYVAFTEIGNVTLTVTKGIHQRTDEKAHMQIETYNARRNGSTCTFHLMLAAEDVAGLANRFRWKGVQFTFVAGNVRYGWPLQALPGGRRRGGSVNTTDLQNHLDAVAAQRRLAQEAAQKEAKANLGDAVEAALKVFLAENPTAVVDRNHKDFAGFKNNGKQLTIRLNYKGAKIQYDKAQNKIVVK